MNAGRDLAGEILTLLSARPLALGGQQGEAEAAWLEAEAQLSEISAAIGSVRFMDPPDGGSVTLAEQVRRMRSALEKAESTLSTTSARAEAQDEGAAGEIYEQAFHPRDGSKFVEPLDEALSRIAAAMAEAKSIGAEYAQVYVRQGDLRSVLNVVNIAHPSPTPAADADRVRIAVEALEKDIRALCVGHPNAEIKWPHRALHDIADGLAALKSTAAKEGGEA